MKTLLIPLLALFFASTLVAQESRLDVPYSEDGGKLTTLDVFYPKNRKNLPVVFWIHGGGWQGGDKTDVQIKPKWFTERGYVFVSVNYRLLPAVDMTTIIRDVARSARWVSDHIAEYGGDPKRLLVMGHLRHPGHHRNRRDPAPGAWPTADEVRPP